MYIVLMFLFQMNFINQFHFVARGIEVNQGTDLKHLEGSFSKLIITLYWFLAF